jgi:hypothetical protein
MKKNRILFLRDYKAFHGGHLKYYNYLQHTQMHSQFDVSLYLTSDSILDDEIDWRNSVHVVDSLTLTDFDSIFVAGNDWRFIPDNTNPKIKIINLIQGTRHADSSNILYSYLNRHAVRVCVSSAVSAAIIATKKVAGPVITIPAALDVVNTSSTGLEYKTQVFIDGIKNQELATKLKDGLRHIGIESHVILSRISRIDYQSYLRNTNVAVFLPYMSEGFYLPALEAMSFGTISVCPDCGGNREYCKDTFNCFNPSYDYDSIFSAVIAAAKLSNDARIALSNAASQTAAAFDLSAERDLFHSLVLDNLSIASQNINEK